MCTTPDTILELMMIQTQGKANVRMDQASLFVVSSRALGGSVTPERNRIMTILMAGLYLMALMGKNLPVLFSSVLVSKKGLLQRCRSFRVKIFSLRYSSSQLFSSSALRHWRKLSQRNFSGTQIFFPAHFPSLAVHLSISPQPSPCSSLISLLPSMQILYPSQHWPGVSPVHLCQPSQPFPSQKVWLEHI